MRNREEIVEVFKYLGLESVEKRKNVLDQGIVFVEPEPEIITYITADKSSWLKSQEEEKNARLESAFGRDT